MLRNIPSISAFTLSQIEKLKIVISQGVELVTTQLACGRLSLTSEASLQLHMGMILQQIGDTYCFSKSESFHVALEVPFTSATTLMKSKTKKALIDLVVTFQDLQHPEQTVTAAIELKHYQAKNQREPNNRYDAFMDLNNLEAYVAAKQADIGAFILITDHIHYTIKPRSLQTNDFDLSHGATYKHGTVLTYRTEKPYGEPIRLNRDYYFEWKEAGDYYELLHWIE
ncbi:hypothetical protein P9314_04740 [Paenibacillus validus]|uniref:Restriction endonuclease n=1 Tax=Paenibacillus chartarius TaxID=747481 RepID=A0ABV6DMH8_9BACL|nr:MULTISPECIES: hypothetical protein [Paenibacillaceae]MED4600015.1 hypothetical protein [Paenibacillus validus]MED4605718.1 hypothetical protein [Paenibacillus validus]